MKSKIFTKLIYIVIAALPIFLNSCLIDEVEQSTKVNQGETFTTKITVSDVTADANANTGAVAILVPNDWEFESGTYETAGGAGAMIIDTNAMPVYGNLDSVIVPPANMKWLRLLSDTGYTNAANAVHEVNVNLTVGTLTGDFPIGYMVTKNNEDLLGALNTTDEDSGSAWADSSMNHMVTVNEIVGVDDLTFVPTEYKLAQNYPNPFNPTTTISFNLKQSEKVSLTVYNALGKEVAKLVNGYMEAGEQQVKFNAAGLTSGVYIYKIKSGSFVESKKMILMK